MPRPLPTAEEAVRILRAKRTRPLRRPPPAAGRSLAKMIRALDARFGQGAEGLQARWREIVGEALSRRTEPVRLITPKTGGGATLELRVEGPSATLIQHQSQEVIDRVNLFLGVGVVARLRIVQAPLRGFKGREPLPAPRRRRPMGPLDAADEARLAESLAALPDGALKAALTRLGREVLRAEAAETR